MNLNVYHRKPRSAFERDLRLRRFGRVDPTHRHFKCYSLRLIIDTEVAPAQHVEPDDGINVLASYKPPEGISFNRVAWSPDGKTLAFVHYSPELVLTTIGRKAVQPSRWRAHSGGTSGISPGSLEAVIWS